MSSCWPGKARGGIQARTFSPAGTASACTVSDCVTQMARRDAAFLAGASGVDDLPVMGIRRPSGLLTSGVVPCAAQRFAAQTEQVRRRTREIQHAAIDDATLEQASLSHFVNSSSCRSELLAQARLTSSSLSVKSSRMRRMRSRWNSAPRAILRRPPAGPEPGRSAPIGVDLRDRLTDGLRIGVRFGSGIAECSRWQEQQRQCERINARAPGKPEHGHRCQCCTHCRRVPRLVRPLSPCCVTRRHTLVNNLCFWYII
jgi:hypothetical protein